MLDLTIDRDIVIDAPAEVVWRVITEPDQIVRWFADRVELEVRPGATGHFVFVADEQGTEVMAALAVESVEPPHRFAFRWSTSADGTLEADNSVLVEFTLTVEDGARTRLRVTETGLDRLAWSDDEKQRYVEDHRHGWAHHFGRLATLLDAGPG